MLQLLGGLSKMQYHYCFKGMENMFGILRFEEHQFPPPFRSYYL